MIWRAVLTHPITKWLIAFGAAVLAFFGIYAIGRNAGQADARAGDLEAANEIRRRAADTKGDHDATVADLNDDELDKRLHDARQRMGGDQ